MTEANGTITTAPDGKIDKRFMAGQPDLERVGHRFLDDTLAYGGIVFKGTILPKNIDPSDFSRTLPPNAKGVPPQMRETFNWVRVKFATENVYVNNQFKRNTICVNNISDDGTDDDEDLIPDKGDIWAFDTPGYAAIRGKGRGDLAKGEVARGQYLFQDDVEYAGVRASGFVVWTWSYSITNPGGRSSSWRTTR